jgi:hypothetical protein
MLLVLTKIPLLDLTILFPFDSGTQATNTAQVMKSSDLIILHGVTNALRLVYPIEFEPTRSFGGFFIV